MLNFYVPRERGSDIASFVEHPVYSIFKMYSVLILVFWVWFATVHPKCMYKSNLFLKFQVFCEGGNFTASFVEHPVFSNFKMYSVLMLVFYFNFATVNPNCMCKSPFFLKFQVFREGSSFIASFVEHPVCSDFKIYSVLILVFLCWFATVNPKYMRKIQFFF